MSAGKSNMHLVHRILSFLPVSSARAPHILRTLQNLFLVPLAVMAFAFLLAGAAHAQCVGKAPKLKPVLGDRSGFALDVPESWNVKATDYRDGLYVVDEDKGCMLEVFRCPTQTSSKGAIELYERVYFGANTIDPECARNVAGRLAWAGEAVLGEYTQRKWGPRVQALFAMLDRELVLLVLKCPQERVKAGDWSTAAAVFASLRRHTPAPQEGAGSSDAASVEEGASPKKESETDKALEQGTPQGSQNQPKVRSRKKGGRSKRGTDPNR